MKTEENKRKHLEFIQNVITRMNTNSFLIKGWNIVIVASLFALSAKDADRGFVLLALFPTIIFWILDTFYLRQERLFRHLYNDVRKIEEDNIDFSMSTKKYNDSKDVQPATVFISITLSIFYLSIFAIITILLIFIKNLKGG
jgi:hypothetical protein